jgi:hypothetical protein
MERSPRKTGTSFKRLEDAGLKVNAKKSFFGRHKLEYLGYWITRSGIMPVPKKIDAIKNIATPKSIRDVRRFVGMVNLLPRHVDQTIQCFGTITQYVQRMPNFTGKMCMKMPSRQ